MLLKSAIQNGAINANFTPERKTTAVGLVRLTARIPNYFSSGLAHGQHCRQPFWFIRVRACMHAFETGVGVPLQLIACAWRNADVIYLYRGRNKEKGD